MNKRILLLVTLLIISTVISCDGGKMKGQLSDDNIIKSVPAEAWKKLAQKKIYFGHQSVGFNIMDGVMDVMKAHPEIKLNIVETTDKSDFKVGLFAHSRVGKNIDPKSKIDEFVHFIDDGIGKEANVAALKFCYVDITSKTTAKDMLEDYSESIVKLKEKYPDLNIIHFTVPLTTNRENWKTWLKKIMGKKNIWEYDDNIKRNEYNEILIKKYQGKEPIFDIAKIESTYPDGTRATFSKDGKNYYSLVPEYTDDGAHLNELGRKKVAEQLLLLFASLK